MTKLNERIANVPERIFILAQLALGLLLAAGGGYCILRFGNDGEHFNSLGLAAALVLCGVGNVFGTKSFMIVVLGGLGSIPGAIIGGLVAALGIYVVMRFA